MSNDRSRAAYPVSLVLALFTCLLTLSGRNFFPVEEAPAFFVEKAAGCWVELGEGFETQGVRQFYDNVTPLDVIMLTGGVVAESALTGDPEWTRPLVRGEQLVVERNSGELMRLSRSWMTAAARITLGIPLDPDHMSPADWPALPGLGPKLAARIEEYRQKNGDFGCLEALRAVSGIGPKRIEAWRPFF